MSAARSWVESRHLRESTGGRAALERCDTLEASIREHILLNGDEIAGTSVAVAHSYFVTAVAVAAADPSSLADWESDGLRLFAAGAGGRDAAQGYYRLDARIAACERGLRAQWIEATIDISETSRRLGTQFLETTGAFLCTPPYPSTERLRAWHHGTLEALGTAKWRGEFAAGALVDSCTALMHTLEADDVQTWTRFLCAIAAATKAGALPEVPEDLAQLTPELAGRAVLAVACHADKFPLSAPALLATLPHALAALPYDAALALADTVTKVATAEGLSDALALVPAVTHGNSEEDVLHLFGLLERIGVAFPEGAASYLRTMARAFDEGGRDGTSMWVEKGIELGRLNREAGIGHLQLHTRNAHKILRMHTTAVSFDEVEGLMQRFLIMMSRRSFQLIPTPGIWFRPPLAAPEDTSLRLPERIDLFETSEDNQALYKLTLAHIAGRFEYGTYNLSRAELVAEGLLGDDPDAESDDVIGVISSFPNPMLAAALFVLLEGVRIDACLEREFAGLAGDFARLGRYYSDNPPPAAADRPAEQLIEALFMMSVGRRAPETLEPRLRRAGAALAPAMAGLRAPEATVYDSARLLLRYYGSLQLAEIRAAALGGEDSELSIEIGGATVIDPFEHLEAQSGEPGAMVSDGGGNLLREIDADLAEQETTLELDGSPEAPATGGVPLTPEEIKALIESGADLRITSEHALEAQQSLGLYITDLLGKLPASAIEELRRSLEQDNAYAAATFLIDRPAEKIHNYDEWDYRIGDYRRHWCKVAEHDISGDSGEYFNRVLASSGDLIASLKREFQRLKPEQYRKVRGMEHGEELDLAALVDAHADRRSRKPPSERLYLARRREERDIATLFLLDMSASTDEPLPESKQDEGGERRVIEVLKDTLVVMSEVTEEIGDGYALYGFSGHGREGVEYFHLKSFSERLSAKVKARLGGLTPKRSTRMGAALRHSGAKLAHVAARSKYLVLLSDGFPQDFDYGEDRRSNVHGIQDTMKALQELEGQGVRTFCITVDPAGHDYLRDMCQESRYAVIDDVASLPEQLPRIYQSLTRS